MALAAELSQMCGEKRVRLGWMSNSDMKVDIGVRREDVTIPIELKYKTDSITAEDDTIDEIFSLSRQSPHDRVHYRFFEDVRRVEEIVSEQGRYGCAVSLTNDSNYWTEQSRSALYDEFRIHEGVTHQGVLHWQEIKPWMVNDGRDHPIELNGEYRIEWTDFSYRHDISLSNNERFRYLVLRVD
jgi:hypothetical protein